MRVSFQQENIELRVSAQPEFTFSRRRPVAFKAVNDNQWIEITVFSSAIEVLNLTHIVKGDRSTAKEQFTMSSFNPRKDHDGDDRSVSLCHGPRFGNTK